jgi:GTP 3',8-cyclase
MYNLVDKHNRYFSYLRLSLTNKCNFNCKYCLPNYKKFKNNINNLSMKEIYNLISAFSELGIQKIRLTGGEPTIRNDFIKIGSIISSFNNIKTLVFTTNGYKLNKIAYDVINVGFSGVNISLDTLDKKNFYLITGKDYYDKVLEGIYKSIDVGLNVKINIVLSSFFTLNDFYNFYLLIKYKNINIRFIDQMETNILKRQSDNYIDSSYIHELLLHDGWKILSSFKTDGPAKIFNNENFSGTIGLISPYSDSFCSTCNRLRVSSFGNLFLCLFGGKSYNIRSYLNSTKYKKLLIYYMKNIIKKKLFSHKINNNKFGIMDTFSSIGG